jgi:DNA helicase-2/ATP-dependent DNA helicase PcrA
MTVLRSLNPAQAEAVRHKDGPLLIIAGAGSGKTRVLTHRIAYLIKEHQVNPHNILAVTFTNKAANEMKGRIRRLVGILSKDMWVGTFHSISGRILRHDMDKLGREKNFVIYDEDDQTSLMKEVIRDLNFDEKHFKPSAVLEAISSAKNRMIGPEAYANAASDFREEKIALAYKAYQDKLSANNALDFDDMLLCTVLLLRNNPAVLEYYQERFRYINVDEYQDTNHVQYTLIKLLAAKYRNICVVGDEDQSIYSWRGADFTNILNFERDYKNAQVVKLEQNYRSTKNILDTANSVIKNNSMRKDKSLWTTNTEGERAVRYLGRDEHDEAFFVAGEIKKFLKDDNKNLNDIVILYRTNAQSRVLEEVFLAEGIPYRILSGVRFYERKEIKDILAYLKVIHNPADNLSLTRVLVNVQEGIGRGTIAKLEKAAAENGVSLFDAALSAEAILQGKARTILKNFTEMIQRLKVLSNTSSVSVLIESLLKETGYLKSLEEEETPESLSRSENVREFLGVAREFERNTDEQSLGAFLAHMSLITDHDTQDEEKNAVTMMTLHGAKGLEFPIVFIVGMEEGIFPHYRSFFDAAGLEEERRLCYVGITRAKEKLYLISVEERSLFGESWLNGESRFLKEIPEDLLKSVKSPRFTLMEEVELSEADDISLIYNVGDRITHPKWGPGEVLALNGRGGSAMLTVAFESVGEKNLMLKYAKLKPSEI